MMMVGAPSESGTIDSLLNLLRVVADSSKHQALLEQMRVHAEEAKSALAKAQEAQAATAREKAELTARREALDAEVLLQEGAKVAIAHERRALDEAQRSHALRVAETDAKTKDLEAQQRRSPSGTRRLISVSPT